MRKKTGYIIAISLVVIGIALAALGLRRTVTIYFNGKPVAFQTYAFTVGWALRSAGVNLSPSDRVQPDTGHLIGWKDAIRFDRAIPVRLWKNGSEQVLMTAERIPANILKQAGVGIFPGDKILWNGQEMPTGVPLPSMPVYFLQYQPAVAVTVMENGKSTRFNSAQPTLGQALSEKGIQVKAADFLSMPVDAILKEPVTVVLRRARPLIIKIAGKQIVGNSAAATVGQALADSGAALQGMDYSIPGSDQPVPDDGNLQLVRVREEVVLEQKTIPQTVVYVTDNKLNLDERKVIDEGQKGLQVSRVRVRYEDGKEVSRKTEMEWTDREAKPQKIALGAKINSGSQTTPNGNISYWRAVTVYATSYSPCRSGGSKCSYGTASGARAQKGVIAVTSAWYRQLAGLQVYIPGYGTAVIGDIGGGIPGKNWIDLAYSDDDYVSWSRDVTLYFLNPPPAVIPSIP
jgi:resuscitation-promoting factor RpfB